MEKTLAIITARGGSKRIPGKNVKEFCGKPIISYSIRAAIESGVFDEVMVSTDDPDIKKIALEFGANVPFMRSEKNSDDFATTGDVLQEVLNMYQKVDNNIDKFCCLYPTAPFVTGNKLRESKELLESPGINTVISVVPFSFPVQRAIIRKNGYGQSLFPQYLSMRSQDLDTTYHDAGQFYWGKAKSFMERPQFIGNNSALYIIDEMEVQDIDTENDWKIAELKYQLLGERK